MPLPSFNMKLQVPGSSSEPLSALTGHRSAAAWQTHTSTVSSDKTLQTRLCSTHSALFAAPSSSASSSGPFLLLPIPTQLQFLFLLHTHSLHLAKNPAQNLASVCLVLFLSNKSTCKNHHHERPLLSLLLFNTASSFGQLFLVLTISFSVYLFSINNNNMCLFYFQEEHEVCMSSSFFSS